MTPRRRRAPAGPARTFARGLGVLRWLLIAGAAVFILAAPGPGTRAVREGWAVIPTLVLPAVAPILFMVLLLDALMSSVFAFDRRGAERVRYRRMALLQLALAVALVIAWYPFFRSILR